jgi:hypothetical protein
MLVQFFPTASNVEGTHLAPDTARVVMPTTADATAFRYFLQHGFAPLRQSLRGEQPQLAATCV